MDDEAWGGKHLPPPNPEPAEPLLPHEQDRLRVLLNAFNAESERVQKAFILKLTQDAIAGGAFFVPSAVNVQKLPRRFRA